MSSTIRRVGPREGYDCWSRTYDQTGSALIALDRREISQRLQAEPGERILDAGCGTATHLVGLDETQARRLGVDLSLGMLAVARSRDRDLPLLQADLDRSLPLAAESFDAALCTLVSEHLPDVEAVVSELFRLLVPGGRLLFSAFHPELAEAGSEANFQQGEVEYRLGAELYSVEDYLGSVEGAGFESITWQEFTGDQALVDVEPSAQKRLGQKLLLLIEARKPKEIDP